MSRRASRSWPRSGRRRPQDPPAPSRDGRLRPQQPERPLLSNTMSVEQVALLALAGFLAGAINAIVGSGSLITFPTLLAIGLPPVTANVTNTVGIVFGSVSAVVGYRRELRPQLRRALWLSIPTIFGAVLGATLVLVLPQKVFGFVVPALVGIAVLLVIIQPRLSARLEREGTRPRWGRYVLPVGIFLTAVYGGYFGAAQGVIL